MSVDFQRLRSGDLWEITQPTSDAIMEVAENWNRHKFDGQAAPPPAYLFEGQIVEVYNSGSANLPAFAAAGLISGGPLVSPSANLAEFQAHVRFSVQAPSSSDAGSFCITIEPIAAGCIGRALVAGVVPVQIYLSAGAVTPTYADVSPGNTYLQPSTGSGAQVLYCQSAPGSGSAAVWAYARIPVGGSARGSSLGLPPGH